MKAFFGVMLTLLFLGCISKNKVIHTSNDDKLKLLQCNLEVRPVFFDTASFTTFKQEYSDFLLSENDFDFFHYFSHGHVEKLKRIYYSSKSGWVLSTIADKRDFKVITVTQDAALRLTELLSKIDQVSYWQVCRANSSSPYYNIYFLKRKGINTLTYYAESGEYNDLNEKDKAKMKEVITVLEFIKGLNVREE